MSGDTEVRQGPAPDAILQVARPSEAEPMVMGTRGQGWECLTTRQNRTGERCSG
ncbi:MAG: hypothetical protein ACOC58_03375 [Chloroflexota bacterium]